MKVIRHDLLHILVWLVIERTVKLCQGKKDGCSCRLTLEGAVTKLGQQVQDLAHLCLRLVRTILSKNPCDDLHQSIWNVWILFQDLQVDLDSALPKLFALLSLLILANRHDELVCELLCDLITTNLEEFVHVANVPVLIRSKLVAEIRDLVDQVLARASFNWSLLQIGKQSINDGLNIDTIGHRIQQIERLDLERVISVLQTVDDKRLILQRVLGVDLDDASKTCNSNILQIV